MLGLFSAVMVAVMKRIASTRLKSRIVTTIDDGLVLTILDEGALTLLEA